jgi:hypothetical protein
VAGDNAVLFVDQHRVGEAKFADRGGDLRDLLVAVRAWSLCVRAFRAWGISAVHRRRTIVSGNVSASKCRASSWRTSRRRSAALALVFYSIKKEGTSASFRLKTARIDDPLQTTSFARVPQASRNSASTKERQY